MAIEMNRILVVACKRIFKYHTNAHTVNRVDDILFFYS